MLRTNSKAAKINLMNYIREDFDYIAEYAEYYGIEPHEIEADNDLCLYIWQIFKTEKGGEIEQQRARGRFVDLYEFFKDWAQGLALGGMFCYYYNISAIDTLGAILEETDDEKAKYTEAEAEERLTKLLFRTIQERAANSFMKFDGVRRA